MNRDERDESKRPRRTASNEEDNTPHHESRTEGRIEEDEEDDTARVERRRHMNMIHSRRKRQRRKIEVEVLKEQVASLTQQNTRLRGENEILEQSVVQARQLAELIEKQSLMKEQQVHGDQKLPAAPRSGEAAAYPNPSSATFFQLQQQQDMLNRSGQGIAAATSAAAWNRYQAFLPPLGFPTSTGIPFNSHNYGMMMDQQQQQQHLTTQQQINLAQLIEQMQKNLQDAQSEK